MIRKQGFQQQVYERHGGPDSRKHKMTGRNLLDVLEIDRRWKHGMDGMSERGSKVYRSPSA